MKNKIITLLLALSCWGPSMAQTEAQADSALVSEPMVGSNVALQQQNITKGMADSAYMANDFAAAILYYEDLLQTKGEAADVYYNLGNSYYKSDNIAKAILNYERALLLKPGDSDIRFNLEMARSKTVDKVNPQSELFFVTWAKQLVNLTGADSWGKWALAFFLLFIVAVVLYMFGKKRSLRIAGFAAACAFLLLTILGNIFGFSQKAELSNRTGAIVIAPSITVKSTPTDSGTELFILHEGHKVTIKDDSMKGWKEIVLEDGNVGWIPTSAIEVI